MEFICFYSICLNSDCKKTSLKEGIRMIFGKVWIILALGWIATVTTQFIYLNTGVVKFITGIGLPVDVKMAGGSLTYFTNFQVFYKLPDNVTYFEPYKMLQKRSVKDTFSRPILYQAFLRYFERLGIYGSECIPRTICEVASREINQEENGLLGEIIHILFSPWEDAQGGLKEYKAAQWQGLNNGSNCGILYRDCFLKENSIFSL